MIGYLRNQRLVDSIDEIESVQVDWETESAAVVTKHKRELSIGKRTVTSGCGQGTVFGDLMEEVDQIELKKDIFLKDTDLFVLLEKVSPRGVQAGRLSGMLLILLGAWTFFR